MIRSGVYFVDYIYFRKSISTTITLPRGLLLPIGPSKLMTRIVESTTHEPRV